MKQQPKSEAQKKLEFKKLQDWIRKLLPDDYDKFDLESEYDSTLTYSENKTEMREKIKGFIKTELPEIKKSEIEELKQQEMEFQKTRDKRIESEIVRYNSKKVPVVKSIESYYSNINRAISKIVQGFSNIAFVKGRGGIGKSWNIRKILVNSKAEFIEINGDVTEAFLYRLFFENNGKIIWFKDVAKLLMGLKSINLLKSATETDKVRVLTKSNYSRAQADLPNRFIWTGKIVFDYNALHGLGLRDDFEALTTRGDYIDTNLSIDDIKQIMTDIAKTKIEQEVTEFVIQEYRYTGYDLLNLRTQWKSIRTREWADANKLDWKQEVMAELRNNESRIKKLLYGLIGNKAIRTLDLKKLLIRAEIVNSLRTADRKVAEWLVMEDIYKVSEEDRNFYVSLSPIQF